MILELISVHHESNGLSRFLVKGFSQGMVLFFLLPLLIYCKTVSTMLRKTDFEDGWPRGIEWNVEAQEVRFCF